VRQKRKQEKIVGILLFVMVCVAVFLGMEQTIQAASNIGNEKLVDLEFFETDIRAAFADVATQAGITILVDDYVEGSITLSLRSVSVDQAIKEMCLKGNYDYAKLRDDLYVVGFLDPSSPTFQKHAITRKVELNYIEADEVIALLEHYDRYLRGSKKTIVIRAWPTLVKKIEDDIHLLDKPVKQVQGRIVIAELTEEARSVLGLNTFEYASKGNGEGWSFSLQPGSVGLSLSDSYRFMMTLSALARAGQATLRASTTITVPEGKESTINIGKEMRIPIKEREEEYTYYYEIAEVSAETSLTLAIDKITSNNEIIFNFKVTTGDIAQEEKTEITNIPSVYRRSAEGTVIVPNNTAFVIGGLTKEIDRAIRSSFPPSKSRTTEKTELIVVVLPHIIGTPMPKPEILEEKLERLTIKPEVKEEFKQGMSLRANYFWTTVNDFVKKQGYRTFGSISFYDGQVNLTPHFALFGGAGSSRRINNRFNIAFYGLLLKTGIVFENPQFFIGVGIANGKLILNEDKYVLGSYMLKAGLELKLGILELGGGYNYLPKEWKKDGIVEKDIDSSGAYGYVGFCLEIE